MPKEIFRVTLTTTEPHFDSKCQSEVLSKSIFLLCLFFVAHSAEFGNHKDAGGNGDNSSDSGSGSSGNNGALKRHLIYAQSW